MNFDLIASFLMFAEQEKKILLRRKANGSYELPGIKIIFGEPVEESLLKYIREKCELEPKNLYYLGTAENIFADGKKHHQYNLIFKLEDHKNHVIPQNGADYEWVSIHLPEGIKFEPEYLKEDIYRWLKGEEVFLSTNKKIYYT